MPLRDGPGTGEGRSPPGGPFPDSRRGGRPKAAAREPGCSGPGTRVIEFLRVYALICVIYLGSNYVNAARAVVLPLTPIDLAVPFMGWTVWVYCSHFAFLPWSVLSLADDAARGRVLRSMLAATVISGTVFMVYPTAVGRDVLPASGEPLPAWEPGRALFDFLYFINTAANAAPSLHVSLALLGAWGLWGERHRRRAAAAAWAAAICLSTLTTKEHYFIDVAGGALVALASRLLACGWAGLREARGRRFRRDSARVPGSGSAATGPRAAAPPWGLRRPA